MTVAILSLLLMVLLLGCLLAGVIMWTTSGGSTGTNGMTCGSCGYAVRGLTQLTCPECGVDLREAGIRPAGSAARRRTGMALTLGSSGLLVLGCFAMGLLYFGLSASHGPVPASAPATGHGTSVTPLSAPATSGSTDADEPSEPGDAADPPTDEEPNR